jgi:hypothetical protein
MPSAIQSRINALSKDIESLSKDVQNDESSRKALLGTLMQGMAKVELPLETVWKMIMSVRIDLGVTPWTLAEHVTASRANGVDGSDPYGRGHGFGGRWKAEDRETTLRKLWWGRDVN